MNAAELTGDALVAAHKSSARWLRIIGIAFPIVFITVIFAYLGSIVGMVRGIDTTAVGSKLSSRVNALLPDLERSVGEIADAVEPALFSALENQSLAMAPQIEKRLRSDVDNTMNQARANLENAARKSMAASADAQRTLLVRELPELASDAAAQDKVLASVAGATATWEQAQLDKTVAEHLIAMEQLRDTLQTSYTAPAGQSADAEDALMTWLNLMNEQVGGEKPILEKEARSPRGKKGAQP